MRLCRAAQQLGRRTVDASDAFIKTASQALRRATTDASGVGPNGDRDRFRIDALASHAETAITSSHPGHSPDTGVHRSAFHGSSSPFIPNDRPRVKSLRNPRRIEFYHRRHREIKKFEKKQDRIQHLRAIAQEKEVHGHSGIAKAAAAEADRLEMPWLATNVPITPPTYASVGQGKGTVAKTVSDTNLTYAGAMLDLKQETKSLDVLNLKVGYAVDAQYALPDEVKAFVLDQTTFCLYGVDKNQVTQIASNIRRIRPPEPYKGAGIRIVGETIKLKERKVK